MSTACDQAVLCLLIVVFPLAFLVFHVWVARDIVRHSPLGYVRHAGFQNVLYGGFYFVCVINLCSDDVFARRYDFGCNFWDREGRNKKKLHQEIVPFSSVSVLAAVMNNIETAVSISLNGAPEAFQKYLDDLPDSGSRHSCSHHVFALCRSRMTGNNTKINTTLTHVTCVWTQ